VCTVHEAGPPPNNQQPPSRAGIGMGGRGGGYDGAGTEYSGGPLGGGGRGRGGGGRGGGGGGGGDPMARFYKPTFLKDPWTGLVQQQQQQGRLLHGCIAQQPPPQQPPPQQEKQQQQPVQATTQPSEARPASGKEAPPAFTLRQTLAKVCVCYGPVVFCSSCTFISQSCRCKEGACE